MCGLGGIVGGRFRASERETAALRLTAALRHRGPDDQASLVVPSGRAALVHTRLAILDRRPVGRQPMTRGPLTISFNGEIYNFRELGDQLMAQGEMFQTETDTEVLLALYARFGSSCLTLLRGMYAFAVWDDEEQSCFLARDPFGIKPLYFHEREDGCLVFASELRALLEGGEMPRRLDSRALDGFLATGSVPEPLTMIEGCRCLPAATWLRWTEKGTTQGTHFRFDFTEREESPGTSVLRTREALLDSIRHHFVSDVPVGLLLSGGLDSNALLALAGQAGFRDLPTFSIGVEDDRLDESAAARRLARHFGANHHEMLLTQELARNWMGPFLDAIDQPTVDGFNVYCACKLAADHGYRVALSGLGADELFGGYPSFRHMPTMLTAGEIARPGRGLLAVAARAGEKLAVESRLARSLDYAAGPATAHRAYAAIRGIFTREEIRRIRHALFPGADSSASEVDGTTLPRHPANAVSYLELTRYLRNQLLRDADVMSMAHGLELRVPLLDTHLFATLRTIPPATRLNAAKQLLRDAVPELPAELLVWRKRGFGLPFASWLEKEWKDLAESLPPIPHLSLRPWSRQWSLLVLTHWMRRHQVTGLSS